MKYCYYFHKEVSDNVIKCIVDALYDILENFEQLLDIPFQTKLLYFIILICNNGNLLLHIHVCG